MCYAFNAQAQDLAQALQLAQQGQYDAADQIYQQALKQNPDNLEAIIGAAYNHSWAGHREKAARGFEAALALDEKNHQALIGAAYNLAWGGRYGSAHQAFFRVSQMYPNDLEARKGLAYVNLWRGNGDAAVVAFQRLSNQQPENMEFRVAQAQAMLLQNRVRDAQRALQNALAISPQHAVAADLLFKTYSLPAALELDLVGGYSEVNGMDNFSLRTIQLSAAMGAHARLFLKYDNSLSTDLSALVRNNLIAQSFSGGMAMMWDQVHTSRLELGVRLLPESVSMVTVNAEHSVAFSGGWLVKTGGFYAMSNQVADEWMGFLGLRAPITSFYAIEPHFFYAKTFNFPEPDKKFMLNNQFRTHGGYELGLGVVYGVTGVRNEANQNDVMGGFVNFLAPFSRRIWATAAFRYEEGPFDKLISATAGLKIRLEN